MVLGVRDDDRNPKLIDNSRSDPLVMSQSEWEHLHRHLHRGREEQMLLAQERAYREYLKEGSNEMTSKWYDSVQNKAKRHNELLGNTQALEDERMAKSKELDDAMAEKKRVFCVEMEGLVKQKKPGPRQLTSALVESNTLQEREAQRKFNATFIEIRRKKNENEGKHAKEDSEKFVREEKAKADKRYADTMATTKVLKDQISTRERNIKASQKLEREQGERDRRAATAEIQQVAAEDRAKFLASRKEFQDTFVSEQKRRKDEQLYVARMDTLEDDICEAVDRGKKRLEKLVKNYNKKRMDDDMIRREEMIKKIFKEKLFDEDALNRQIEQTIKANNDKMDAQQKAKEEWKAAVAAEMNRDRATFEAEEAQRKREEKEQQRWIMLNNKKQVEVSRAYEERKFAKHKEYCRKNGEDLLAQMKVNQDWRALKEKQDVLDMTLVNRINDEDYFDYATKTVAMAKKAGMPIYPLEKAIYAYKKDNSLLPHKKIVCVAKSQKVRKQSDSSSFEPKRKCSRGKN